MIELELSEELAYATNFSVFGFTTGLKLRSEDFDELCDVCLFSVLILGIVDDEEEEQRLIVRERDGLFEEKKMREKSKCLIQSETKRSVLIALSPNPRMDSYL